MTKIVLILEMEIHGYETCMTCGIDKLIGCKKEYLKPYYISDEDLEMIKDKSGELATLKELAK